MSGFRPTSGAICTKREVISSDQGGPRTRETEQSYKRPQSPQKALIEMNIIKARKQFMRPGYKKTRIKIGIMDDSTIEFSLQVGDYHIGSLIITTKIGSYHMWRILIDTGASSYIFYEQFFRRMTTEDQRRLVRLDAPIIGLLGETVYPFGEITSSNSG
jgi:hypothetical protein